MSGQARVLALRLELDTTPPSLVLETSRGTLRVSGTVTVKLQTSPARGFEAWIDVEDNGPGVEPWSAWMRWVTGAAADAQLVPERLCE